MKGYKQKPLLIEIFALIYLLNPIGNLISVIYLNTTNSPMHNFKTLLALASQGNVIIILNIIFWLSALPLSYGLFKVRLWAWYYFLVHSIGMVILSLFGSDFKIHFSFATIVNVLFLIPIGYFISNEIRTPYFNPRVRWWEQSKRFIHDLKIIIEGKEYETYDISQTGVFIKSDVEGEFNIGELAQMTLIIEDKTINCFSEIRWVNNDKTKYPKGYGVKFEKIARKDRQIIKDFIKLLQKVGKQESR